MKYVQTILECLAWATLVVCTYIVLLYIYFSL